MTQTVRVNGVDVPVDQFEGAGEELTHAYRRFHARQARNIQGGPLGTYGAGIPRHRKHKGDAVNGVRFK